MKESEIRESIAANLALLDSHLKLVAQEHYISMPDGRTAFIDIFAKDEYGCFTVIEIKKSNQTARSAVQQLYKYANFLKRKNRLEVNQIRCIILSTVWDELDAPFSEFSHFSEYESKGYKVDFKDNMVPVYSEVTPVYITGNISPLKSLIFFEFKESECRNKVLDDFKKTLKMLPSVNNVLIKMDYDGNDKNIINPYGFSWTLFTGDINDMTSDLSKVKPYVSSESHFDPENIVELWEDESPESLIRTQILNKYVRIENGKGEYTGLALHSLNNTLSTWKHDSPVGLGVMFDDSLFDSDDIRSMSCGFVGDHPYNFVIKTTPMRPSQFKMVREKLNIFLASNSHWRKQVNHIMSSMEETDTADISIYNPLNFFGMINDIFKHGNSERVPQLYINVNKNDGTTIKYSGGLFWRKTTKLLPPISAIQYSYPDTQTFRHRQIQHRINKYDEALSKQYGLAYDVICILHEKVYLLAIEGEDCYLKENVNIKNLQVFLSSNDSLIDAVGKLFLKWKIGNL